MFPFFDNKITADCCEEAIYRIHLNLGGLCDLALGLSSCIFEHVIESGNFNTHSEIFPGKHATGEKEGLSKRGMSKPGRAVVLSGTSTDPPYSDVPVDLSSDDKDLVMEYSGKANLMCTAS